MSRAAMLFGLAAIASAFAVPTGEGHAAPRAVEPLQPRKLRREEARNKRKAAKKGNWVTT